jgi:hypothetical protein
MSFTQLESTASEMARFFISTLYDILLALNSLALFTAAVGESVVIASATNGFWCKVSGVTAIS